jgi:hypothetical protein
MLHVLILIYYQQGCGYNCHKQCMKNVPNNCGINERAMSEILEEIKRKDVIYKCKL